MKSKKFQLKLAVYLCFLFLFVIPKPAHAYLDPSTGSYLFQFLIAGLLGGTFFLKGYLFKVKDKLNKMLGKTSSEKSSKKDEK